MTMGLGGVSAFAAELRCWSAGGRRCLVGGCAIGLWRLCRCCRRLGQPWGALLHHQYDPLAVGGPLVALDIISDGGQRPRLTTAAIEQHDLTFVGACGGVQVREVAAVAAPARRADFVPGIGELNLLRAVPARHPDRAATLVGVAIVATHDIGDPFPVRRDLGVANELQIVEVVGSQRAAGRSCVRRSNGIQEEKGQGNQGGRLLHSGAPCAMVVQRADYALTLNPKVRPPTPVRVRSAHSQSSLSTERTVAIQSL